MSRKSCKLKTVKNSRTQDDSRSQHVLETTLAIIKPDGMPHRQDILSIILKSGFQILQREMVRLSPEQASDFYKDKYALKSFNLMVLSLSESPIEVMVLAKDNCIEDWKCLMGPEKTSDAILCYPDTIRGMFGTCADDERNVVHGSEDRPSARLEIHYFFPNFIVEPILQEDAHKLCCQNVLMSTLFDGLYKVSVERPFDPVAWLAQWLLHNNPLKPIISDTSVQTQSKIGELEKMAASTGDKLHRSHYQASISRDSISSTSTSVRSCICSCDTLAPSSAEVAPKSTHDMTCSCRMVLDPKDVTFCPICHKIMKLQVKPMERLKQSSSSHVVTASSSTTVETQTESSSATASEMVHLSIAGFTV